MSESDKDDDPGKPPDALAPFAKAIIDAAKTETQGDANVSRAFALGWHVSELTAPGEPTSGLPGMSGQDESVREQTLLKQIKADANFLADAIEKVGLPELKVDDLANEPDALHSELLSTLTATDFRLGKAYGLGHALAHTTRTATIELLRTERVRKLLEWLDELSSVLPPHASGSVSHSLGTWAGKATLSEQEGHQLRRQGELWRALLSGEKRGREMLCAEEYLDAADKFAKETGKLVRKTFKRFPVLTGAVVVLVIGGIALLAIDSSGSIVAGATSLIAAFGLSWKGLGGAVGKLVTAVEEPLWGAQLDLAIARAMTPQENDPSTDPWTLSRLRPPAKSKGARPL